MPEAEVRARHELGERQVVLTVSAKRAHKNLLVLVRAMSRLREDQPNAVLVLPGNHTEYESSVLMPAARELGIDDQIRFAGYVSAEELEGLYRAASVFVFPSLMEGFGLPVLEAMRRGVPVAASRIPALTEVAGDAARYFEPEDPAEIAAVLGQILGDDALRERMAGQGRRQQSTFSLERTVAETLESYYRALTAASRG